MRIRKLLRHPATWVVLGIGAVAFAVALYLFQPWRLFTTVEVNEAPPAAVAASRAPGATPQTTGGEPAGGPKVLATGTFVSHEHDTAGTARLLELADGSRVLRIEDLDTSDGPDLRVWLSDQPVKEGRAGWFNLDDGKHLELGDLKGNKGDANYAVPAGADLDALKTVTIWCKRFSVSFGAAALT
ncbi:DM13 domain-containing protein [Planomonospora sp. ID67723]|uniref:DM13 domain-containing protein n=1 Tax=Planomonospora sp. ID67723 TaxID=2738134 RepID=UPI0018C39917|nr:DM13 domain-containing protein [Planomonospora sp. ID67723]MBG0827051.1 DM13 domain-containing protein [Planomonospora sp. ID67723]